MQRERGTEGGGREKESMMGSGGGERGSESESDREGKQEEERKRWWRDGGGRKTGRDTPQKGNLLNFALACVYLRVSVCMSTWQPQINHPVK